MGDFKSSVGISNQSDTVDGRYHTWKLSFILGYSNKLSSYQTYAFYSANGNNAKKEEKKEIVVNLVYPTKVGFGN